MFRLIFLLVALASAMSFASHDVAQSHPVVESTAAPDEAPTYSFQVRATDPARLHAALAEYSRLFGYSLAFRDPPSVPPRSRLYELTGADSHIRVFNPFDPQIYFFSIFAENEARARQVCQQIIRALTGHRFVAAPPVDFGNPPPYCPR